MPHDRSRSLTRPRHRPHWPGSRYAPDWPGSRSPSAVASACRPRSARNWSSLQAQRAASAPGAFSASQIAVSRRWNRSRSGLSTAADSSTRRAADSRSARLPGPLACEVSPGPGPDWPNSQFVITYTGARPAQGLRSCRLSGAISRDSIMMPTRWRSLIMLRRRSQPIQLST